MSSNEYGDKSLCKYGLAGVAFIAATGFLALAGLRTVINTPVEAQSPGVNLYIEPGTIAIRRPDGGGTLGDGKMVSISRPVMCGDSLRT